MTDYTIKIDKLGRPIGGAQTIQEFKAGDNLSFVYEGEQPHVHMRVNALDSKSFAEHGTRIHQEIERLQKRHGPKLRITDLDFNEIESRVMARYGEIPEWAKPHVKLDRLRRACKSATYYPHQLEALEWIRENRHRVAAGDTVTVVNGRYPLYAFDEAGDIDETVWHTIQSKQKVVDDILKGPNHGEADPETEASDVRSDAGRLDGRRHGARTGRWSTRQVGAGARQGEEPGEVVARASRAGNRSGGRYAPAKDDASVGEADRRGAVSIFNITIKQEPMGAVAEIKAGSLWDSKGYATGYTATAPEIDRLIAELGKTRDKIRQLNRPKHYFGQTP